MLSLVPTHSIGGARAEFSYPISVPDNVSWQFLLQVSETVAYLTRGCTKRIGRNLLTFSIHSQNEKEVAWRIWCFPRPLMPSSSWWERCTYVARTGILFWENDDWSKEGFMSQCAVQARDRATKHQLVINYHITFNNRIPEYKNSYIQISSRKPASIQKVGDKPDIRWKTHPQFIPYHTLPKLSHFGGAEWNILLLHIMTNMSHQIITTVPEWVYYAAYGT